MTWRRRLVVGTVLLTTAACGGDDDAARPVAPEVFDVTAGGPDDLPAAATAPLMDPAALRGLLQLLLGEHALLTAGMVRDVAGGTDPAVAVAALERNTDELSATISLVYGADAGAAFAQIWDQHAQFFADDAAAAAGGDEDGRDVAHDHLGDYRDDFASFLATAVASPDSQELFADLLQAHVDQLTAITDARVADDPAAEAGQVAEAYEHMLAIATGLADAISAQHPDLFPPAAAGAAGGDDPRALANELALQSDLLLHADELGGDAVLTTLDARARGLAELLGTTEAVVTEWSRGVLAGREPSGLPDGLRDVTPLLLELRAADDATRLDGEPALLRSL